MEYNIQWYIGPMRLCIFNRWILDIDLYYLAREVVERVATAANELTTRIHTGILSTPCRIGIVIGYMNIILYLL